MWWEVVFQPTTLFSLKSSEASNAAGKSLFFPSPYSIKMALLNAICTYDSVTTAIEHFDLIKELKIQVMLPDKFVVNNCFVRIMQESRGETRKESPNIMFKSTVVFREYLYLDGNISVAISNSEEINESDIRFLRNSFSKINYFGKRGCFFQFIDFASSPIQILPNYYSQDISNNEFFENGKHKIICRVDDFGPTTTFAKVNNFSKEKTERISKIVCLPYKMVTSNKNFSLFQRT
jgi:hypothetical protein